MRFHLSLLKFLAVGFLLTISGLAVNAQSDRGAISGTIVDTSGGAVEGASIVATGKDTGAVYRTTSSATGAYRISDMQVGAYDISVTSAGFKTSEQKGFIVQINSTSSLDITLEAGDIKETLTVLADTPTLQTDTS